MKGLRGVGGGWGSWGTGIVGSALLRREPRAPCLALRARVETAAIVRLIRVPLILLWRIIRSLLRCRSGDTGDIWQRDRDPRLLLCRRERTPQDRRNCPNKNNTKRRAGSRSKIELHVTPPSEAP